MALEKKQMKTCICEKQKDCVAVSSAFRILKDPRCGFLELPVRASEGGGVVSFDSQFEEACFPHLRPDEKQEIKRHDSDSSPRYVALHHFHPEIVLHCTEAGERSSSPPVLSVSTLGTSLSTLSESTIKVIEFKLGEEDRALLKKKKAVGTYHIFPNYGLERAKSDVKQGLEQILIKDKKRKKDKDSEKSNSVDSPTASISSTAKVLDAKSRPLPPSPLSEGKGKGKPKYTINTQDLDRTDTDNTVDTGCESSLEPSTASPNKGEDSVGIQKFKDEEYLSVQKLRENRVAEKVWPARYNNTVVTLDSESDQGLDDGKPCQTIGFIPSDFSLESFESNDAESPRSLRPVKRVLHSRSESMPILSVIEIKRRVCMSSRLDAVLLEWNCYKDLIDDICQETNRVDVLLQTSYQSLEIYADSMRLISNDTFLDDKGGVLHGTRRQDKIATQRGQAAKGIDTESSMLNMLFYSFDQLAGRLDENLPALFEGAQEIADLKVDVQRQAEALRESGELILGEIEMYERNGVDAWGKF
jgi:hypothetical protein